ncbi:MAG: hypothetical protein P8077_05740 [Gammaproteobacteria bacterium]
MRLIDKVMRPLIGVDADVGVLRSIACKIITVGRWLLFVILTWGLSACQERLARDTIWGVPSAPFLSRSGKPEVAPLLAYFQRMHDVEAVCFSVDALLPTFFARGWQDNPGPNAPISVLASQPLLQLMTAHCELRRAWGFELEMLKQTRRGAKSLALDQGIQRERALERAVTLNWQGYRAIAEWLMADAVSHNESEACQLADALHDGDLEDLEDLEHSDASASAQSELPDATQLMLLTASLNGFLATLYDQMLVYPVGVPAEVAQGARAMVACVDNARWWSMPRALQAALNSLSPTADRRIFRAELQEALALPESNDVRWASAIGVMMAARWGENTRVRDMLSRFFRERRYSESAQWRLWDEWAVEYMTYFSDREWVRNTGARTPADQLGMTPKSPAVSRTKKSNGVSGSHLNKSPSASPARKPTELDLKDVL